MTRPLLPWLLIFAAFAGLGAIAYPTIPQYTTTTYFSMSTGTATASAYWVDYSYLNVTCTGTVSTGCYQQMVPYTYTETWIGETSEVGPIYSVSERQVPYAASGLTGAVAAILLLGILLLGIGMMARTIRAKPAHLRIHSGTDLDSERTVPQ